MLTVFYCILIFTLFKGPLADDEPLDLSLFTKELKENVTRVLQAYLNSLSANVDMDVVVLLTRESYFESGPLEQIDTLAFFAESDTTTFNLSTLSRTSTDRLQDRAEDNNIILSLLQSQFGADGNETKTTFHTEETVVPDTAASVIAKTDRESLDLRYLEEIADTLDMSEKRGTIQMVEYHKNGNIKRNRTTTIYPQKITIDVAENMTPRMQQSAEALIKTAYKVDTEQRSQMIGDLFDKKFPTYTWQVIANATHYWIDDNDVQINVRIGNDSYDIVGDKK